MKKPRNKRDVEGRIKILFRKKKEMVTKSKMSVKSSVSNEEAKQMIDNGNREQDNVNIEK